MFSSSFSLFRVTNHRRQGQTLSRVVFDLRTEVCLHGRLYVGLSGVRKSADITMSTT